MTTTGNAVICVMRLKPKPWRCWKRKIMRSDSSFLLLAQSHWHHGVIGIVAARLMERYHRPVALLAGDGDGQSAGVGSAAPGFAMDQALNAC